MREPTHPGVRAAAGSFAAAVGRREKFRSRKPKGAMKMTVAGNTDAKVSNLILFFLFLFCCDIALFLTLSLRMIFLSLSPAPLPSSNISRSWRSS